MPLSAGLLRSRLTVRRKSSVRNADGGYDESWGDVADIWAEVIGLNGRESVIGRAVQGTSYYQITIRPRSDLTAGDQLRYGTADLNIRSIMDPDGRREKLIILADTGSVEQ